MQRYQRPEGTHDILVPSTTTRTKWADDIHKWHWLESVARDLCAAYGYEEVRTPIFEQTSLFHRAVGEGTDIVSKEMYEFTTKGGDAFTLRPEGTAPALRAYVQNRLDLSRPVNKLYYVAPIFRYERPQEGRYRQHHQFGIEALGAQGPDIDAEVISLANAFLQRLGVKGYNLRINSVGTVASRAHYIEALRTYAEPLLPEMSEDNQRRFRENALRMLDSKNQRDQELLADAPTLTEYLDDESRAHYETLQGLLSDLGIAFQHDPRLVRGFDYYTRTAFEFESPDVSDRGMVTIIGGGRYDKLVEELGGPPTPGIGFGSGIERVLLALEKTGATPAEAPAPDAFFCPLGEAARRRCVALLADLRAAGLAADMDYTGRRMKVMFEQADQLRARYAVILGDDELAQGVAKVRDQRAEGKPQSTVPLDELAAYLRSAR